jgi:flavin-binding protein dodecin
MPHSWDAALDDAFQKASEALLGGQRQLDGFQKAAASHLVNGSTVVMS